MKLSLPGSADCLPIAAVERDTGLLKDTLRVWERRYGFPKPLRDAKGERLYPREQVERLRAIRRLMDQGLRPGKLFAASEAELHALIRSADPTYADPRHEALFALILSRDAAALFGGLQAALAELGLERFVLELATPLSRGVGEAWARGELDVAQEHLYTEQLQNLLRAHLTQLPSVTGAPRVLLTTVPGEEHTLGLLCAQCLLAGRNAACTSLGAQTPLADIRQTLHSGRYDVLLLAFSSSFLARRAMTTLQELASSLPPGCEIWAAGRHLADKLREIPGLSYLASMANTLQALDDWRRKTLPGKD